MDGSLITGSPSSAPYSSTAASRSRRSPKRVGTRLSRRFATAPFAHVPERLGSVPIFVDRLAGHAHRIGVRVNVWTVDDPHQMHELLDTGVDGIITDRPDVLREVLIARGEWTTMSPLPAAIVERACRSAATEEAAPAAT